LAFGLQKDRKEWNREKHARPPLILLATEDASNKRADWGDRIRDGTSNAIGGQGRDGTGIFSHLVMRKGGNVLEAINWLTGKKKGGEEAECSRGGTGRRKKRGGLNPALLACCPGRVSQHLEGRTLRNPATGH